MMQVVLAVTLVTTGICDRSIKFTGDAVEFGMWQKRLALVLGRSISRENWLETGSMDGYTSWGGSRLVPPPEACPERVDVCIAREIDRVREREIIQLV